MSCLTPFPEQRCPLDPTGQVKVVRLEEETHCRFRQARLVPHELPSGTNPVLTASLLSEKCPLWTDTRFEYHLSNYHWRLS